MSGHDRHFNLFYQSDLLCKCGLTLNGCLNSVCDWIIAIVGLSSILVEKDFMFFLNGFVS